MERIKLNQKKMELAFLLVHTGVKMSHGKADDLKKKNYGLKQFITVKNIS